MVMSGLRAGVFMADQVPTIHEIDNVDKLEAYLRKRPAWEARAVAAKMALRALPFLVTALSLEDFDALSKKRLVLANFRLNFLSWYKLTFSAHPYVAGASDSLIAIVDEFPPSIGASSVAAAYAFDANFRSAERDIPRDAMEAIHAAFRAGSFWGEGSAWPVLRADLDFCRRVGKLRFMHAPLWSAQFEPTTLSGIETAFYNELANLGLNWLAVFAFYSQLRHFNFNMLFFGEKQHEAISVVARSNNDFWDRDPDDVMKDILEQLGLSQQNEHVPSDTKSTSNDTDFFISYSTKNETSAREINSYLEDAGYSTIAQFKDFPVGSNFVIEMQDGLERGARAIALLSPDYVASDHCRAEWAAIYNMDPIGKRRKLVSFLLEPTELNKLQRQIVYSSLTGLKQDARRKAVLDAVRHVVEVVTPDQLKQKLADIASPDVAVTADGKIDVTPNTKYDLAVNSPDLPDLPTSLRVLCAVIEASLPENSPKSIAPNLRGYRGHLEERGANPIVGLLGMLVTALTKEFESADFEFWGSGLNENFESFFACHSKFLGHFPRSGEREQTYAEAEIDEDEASGDDLIQPVQSVADAVEELKAIGKVTPGLERVVQGQVQTAKDVSSLPPNLSEDAGKGNVITPKRRFVLSQLGFWERMLAAVGSMTTLATTPQGQAAIAALQDAIAKFLLLIL